MTLPTRKETAPALLRVLHRLGGEAPAHEVIPLVTDEFPQITPDDLAETLESGPGKWENRIAWACADLRKAGDVRPPEKGKRGIWALTEQGREKATALAGTAATPPDRHHRQPTGDDDDDDLPADRDDDGDEFAEPPFGDRAGEADRIASDSKAAGTDSKNPERLEIAITDALRFLGFEAKHLGGPGRADVVAYAELGIDRYSVALDAKSAATGLVGDHQINWDSIDDHRKQEHADYSCIVGPSFAGGNLPGRAAHHGTRLLTLDQLAQIVRTHAESPLSLKQLERLFMAKSDATTALNDLQAESSENSRRRLLQVRLMRIIDRFNRAKPNDVLAKPETLRGILLQGPDPDASLEEVEAALSVLETLGILRRDNGEGYVSQTSLASAKQMLDAFPSEDPPSR